MLCGKFLLEYTVLYPRRRCSSCTGLL